MRNGQKLGPYIVESPYQLVMEYFIVTTVDGCFALLLLQPFWVGFLLLAPNSHGMHAHFPYPKYALSFNIRYIFSSVLLTLAYIRISWSAY
jgi:hypothetical protein